MTQTEVISNAITLLGKGIITTLAGQPPIVDAAVQAYNLLYPFIIATKKWRFATTIAALVNDGVTPVGGYWQYTYSLPADYLELVHVYPQTYEFEVYNNNKIYSNFNNQGQPFYLEYQFLPPITACPIYFCYALIKFIASYLSLSTAQNVQYAASLKNDYETIIGQAQAIDAQNRPQTPLQNSPALTNRFVSTYASG